MLIDNILIENKLGNRIKESFIKKNYYDEWVNINSFSKEYGFEDLKWTNKVFNYMFNIIEIPKCICGKYLNFRGRIDTIYTKYCSNKCSSNTNIESRIKKLKSNNLEKYGVENVFQLNTTKEKSKNTNRYKYGFDNPNKNKDVRDRIKKTNLEKYGVQCPFNIKSVRNNSIQKTKDNFKNKEWYEWYYNIMLKNNGGIGFASDKITQKYINTCLSKWGVKNPFQSTEVKQKIKQHYLDKYGVSHPQQVEEIHNRTISTSLYCKSYKDTDLYYQGSYELDFLDKYYDKIKIKRSKLIRYEMEGESKIYYPDFYLPDYDLIVEIKSSYTWKRNLLSNLAKLKHIEENNINFTLIMNKNYIEFDSIIK